MYYFSSQLETPHVTSLTELELVEVIKFYSLLRAQAKHKPMTLHTEFDSCQLPKRSQLQLRFTEAVLRLAVVLSGSYPIVSSRPVGSCPIESCLVDSCPLGNCLDAQLAERATNT